MTYDPTPPATVVAYTPPTPLNPGASVDVTCPLGCVERDRWHRPVLDDSGLPIPITHRHGIGPAGAAPALGDRAAHCRDDVHEGRGYVLTDPHGIVPARITQPAVAAR